MKIPILNLKLEQIDEVEIPSVFTTPFREDIIKRAVLSEQSYKYQPQGRDPMAGKRTTAESRGVGHGIARVPRIKGSSRAAFGVSIVGGHQAFPPKSEKVIIKKINKKEREFAIKSGIAATANKKIVINRGHILEKDIKLPIVVDNEIESLDRTSKVKEFLITLGIWGDVNRVNRKKIRAGRGKMRGRKRKVGKGPLIVISEDKGIRKASRNIPGLDTINVNKLSAELLAPGTHPGRLVIWSKEAFNMLNKKWRN